VTKVDLHCHSSASAVAGLAVQAALGLPECATPPEEVHALGKRRGMDFVTITDHDTIDGVLAIADRPDVFVSEELTAAFRGELFGTWEVRNGARDAELNLPDGSRPAGTPRSQPTPRPRSG
jgi:hypothetical protein